MKKTCTHYPTWSTLVRERTRRINEGMFQRNSTYHYPDEFRSIHIENVLYSNEFHKPAFFVTLKNGRTLKLTLKNMDIEHYDALIQWTEFQHGILSGHPKGTGPSVNWSGETLGSVSA